VGTVSHHSKCRQSVHATWRHFKVEFYFLEFYFPKCRRPYITTLTTTKNENENSNPWNPESSTHFSSFRLSVLRPLATVAKRESKNSYFYFLFLLFRKKCSLRGVKTGKSKSSCFSSSKNSFEK